MFPIPKNGAFWVEAWTAEVGSKAFRGGDQPDLSDLAVFGCIRGIKDLPLHAEMAEHKAQKSIKK